MADLALADVTRAARFAAERHAAQKRKGAAQEPYFNHLAEVADLLAAATGGTDPALVMAGYLHDTIEDVGVAYEDLEGRFGADVAQLVLAVTDDKTLPKAERKRRQAEHASELPPRAKMLKIADKIANLRAIRASPPPDWPHERKTEYFDWAKSVVAGCRGVNATLEAAFDREYGLGPG